MMNECHKEYKYTYKYANDRNAKGTTSIKVLNQCIRKKRGKIIEKGFFTLTHTDTTKSEVIKRVQFVENLIEIMTFEDGRTCFNQEKSKEGHGTSFHSDTQIILF